MVCQRQRCCFIHFPFSDDVMFLRVAKTALWPCGKKIVAPPGAESNHGERKASRDALPVV